MAYRIGIGLCILRNLAAEVDLDYLAGSAIAVAREVGERMMARRPVDVASAADFVVRLIMGGVPGRRRPAIRGLSTSSASTRSRCSAGTTSRT